MQPVKGFLKSYKRLKIVNTLSYRTIAANASTVNKEWVVIDVDGLPLGRSASFIANLLRGKHKTNYTPHVDCGDNVIVVNAANISLSGNKWEQKKYIRHTGYPGGQRILNATQAHAKNPTRIMENAVKGMLPKNKLGSALFRNLKVYADANHPHEAQNPKTINLTKL